MPFAPVGGTMCAASPARNSRPYCIGTATKLRIGVIPLSSKGPSVNVKPSSVASRVCSSDQIRSSGHCAMSSSGATCRYIRVTSGERIECSAKPFSWRA